MFGVIGATAQRRHESPPFSRFDPFGERSIICGKVGLRPILLDVRPGQYSTKFLTGRLLPEFRLLILNIFTEKVSFRIPSFEKMVPF